jgi:Zn-dependent peptidase ImmA (M78 family)
MTTAEREEGELAVSAVYRAQRAARDASERVLLQYWDEDLYPIDPFTIATKMGVEIYSGDLPGDVSGMLRSTGTGVELYVDTDDSFRRQRFTVAHELGHLVNHRDRGDLDAVSFVDKRSELSRRGTDLDEIYANEFAACLLMPQALVRSLHRQGLDDWELARFFDVSPSAMTFRLRNLGLER